MGGKRRQPVNSITAQVSIMQKALQELQPPEHLPLTEADLPFWRSITAEKPKSEWTGHDLEIAAMLAQSLRKLRDEELQLDVEGSVVKEDGRNPTANPRLRIVADLHARAMKYRQTLGIHNRGKEGEARDVAKRRAQAFDVEADNPLNDSLLASPQTVQ